MFFKTKDDYRKAWDDAYRVDPAVPLNLDIELASACNLACPFCSWGESEFAQKMKAERDFDGKPKKRFMPTELATGLIDEAAALGIPAIKFNYRGESTLHKDFSEIVAHAAARFHDLLINTNANCDERALLGLLKCTKVMVSLDSMDPHVYPQIRIGGDLETAIRTIDLLVQEKHPNVWVRRVVCKTNKHERFIEQVKERWGDSVKASEHFAFDRNKDQKQSVHDASPEAWDRQYCGYPSQRIVVTASGKYLPCCMAWRDEFNLGDVHTMSLAQYWASAGRKALANQLRKNVLKNPLCKNCTSFMAYKRPERTFVQDVEGEARV